MHPMRVLPVIHQLLLDHVELKTNVKQYGSASESHGIADLPSRIQLSRYSTDSNFSVHFSPLESCALSSPSLVSLAFHRHIVERTAQPYMLTDQDIRSAARLLVTQRGVCAPSHAAMRAALLIKEGNQRGGADWLRVKLAAEKLLAAGVTHAE
jgi:hypothetical protein